MKKWMMLFVLAIVFFVKFGGENLNGNLVCCAESKTTNEDFDSLRSEKDQDVELKHKDDGDEFHFIQKDEPASVADTNDIDYIFYSGVGLIVLGSAGIIYVCYSVFGVKILSAMKQKRATKMKH